MPPFDGRSEVRHQLRVPIRFCSADGSGTDGETCAEAKNISRNGLFMASPKRLIVGSLLMLAMRVPTEISGSVFSELRCMGRVVHEQKMEDGSLGYGVKIEAMAPRHPAGLRVGALREQTPAGA
jgi:hypothetical protein